MDGKCFHIPAHAGHNCCWEYSGHWDRTVAAIDRHSLTGRKLFSSAGDDYVEDRHCVVQYMSDEQYAALPARLRRRLDTVKGGE